MKKPAWFASAGFFACTIRRIPLNAWEDLIKNPPEGTPVEDNPWRRAHSPAEWVWMYDPRDILPEMDDDEVS